MVGYLTDDGATQDGFGHRPLVSLEEPAIDRYDSDRWEIVGRRGSERKGRADDPKLSTEA